MILCCRFNLCHIPQSLHGFEMSGRHFHCEGKCVTVMKFLVLALMFMVVCWLLFCCFDTQVSRRVPAEVTCFGLK